MLFNQVTLNRDIDDAMHNGNRWLERPYRIKGLNLLLQYVNIVSRLFCLREKFKQKIVYRMDNVH